MKHLYVVAATQYRPNKKQEFILDLLNIIFFKKINVLINQDFSDLYIKNNNYISIKMEDSLFDFSRYESSLKLINDPNSVIFAFNDTLGNGRKLNFFLYLFIIISIILISFNFYNFASPIDKDKFREWISPYFFIGKFKIVKQLNWNDPEKAKNSLEKAEIYMLKKWVKNKWRQSKNSSKNQKEIKLKTLFLEKNLINSIQYDTWRILKFEKYSLWRILNSVMPF